LMRFVIAAELIGASVFLITALSFPAQIMFFSVLTLAWCVAAPVLGVLMVLSGMISFGGKSILGFTAEAIGSLALMSEGQFTIC
jgi:hypothetical protein